MTGATDVADEGAPAPKAGPEAVSGLERAAVVLSLLGEEAARPIAERLGDRELRRIADAMGALDVLPASRVAGIAADFLSGLAASKGSLRGGRERARSLVEALVGPERMSVILGDDDPLDAAGGADSPAARTWRRLGRSSAKDVAAYLSSLTPNLAAMLVQRLGSDEATAVIAELDEDVLRPVIGELVAGHPVPPAVEQVLGRMVETDFLAAQESGGGSEARTAHLEGLGELISLLPGERRTVFMGELETNHAAALAAIKSALFTVEALPEAVEVADLPEIVRTAGDAATLAFLSSIPKAQSAVADFVLSGLPTRMAEGLRLDLELSPPLDAEAAEAAQSAFFQVLMDMRREGRLQRPGKAGRAAA